MAKKAKKEVEADPVAEPETCACPYLISADVTRHVGMRMDNGICVVVVDDREVRFTYEPGKPLKLTITQ